MRFRVLDFSRLLPGPFATQRLRDLGCQVTHVELPHFPDRKELWMVNQGKRRLSIDFRKAAGLARVKRLISRSDVLVESFRPGVMTRMGLGYEAARKLRPGLVYCSLTGYRPDGPWGHKAGHDLNCLAMSGFMAGKPAFPEVQVADYAGSMEAVSGILAALLEGRGRHLKISLTDALNAAIVLPRLEGAPWWDGSHPFYRVYETKDGGYLAVAAVEPNFRSALLHFLGLPAEPQDPAAVLAAAFSRLPLSEWKKRLEGRDLCVTPVLSLAEAAVFLARAT